MTLQASVGDLVQIQFPAFDVDGITPLIGLLDSDFSKLLLVDDSVSAQPITITEIGSTGRYVIKFTPNADGLWYAEIETPVEDVFADQVEVGPPPDDWLDAIWSVILPGTYPVDSAGARIANIDINAETLYSALIMGIYSATGGGVDGVETDAVKADGFYDGLTLVVRNSSGNVSRRIDSYVQSNGTFYFADDLPFTPAAGDDVVVLGLLGKVLCENSSVVLDKLVEVWQRLGLDPDNPLCITKTAQEANGWRLVHTEVGHKLIVTREDV